MASRSVATAERVALRAWGRVALMALALLVCLPLHGVWRLFGQRSPWPQRFLFLAGRAAGARVRTIGQPVAHQVLYIANHLSWLDILVIAGETGSAFVAKADMAPWPVIGWLATLNNSVYVQRDQRLSAHVQAQMIRNALESRQPLTLFPEGTTGNGLELLPFRSSLVAAVTPPPEGVTIQPLVIDYGAAAPAIAWTDDEPVGRNALRVLSRRGRIEIALHFLRPLDHADFDDRKAITAHSRDAIAAVLFPAYSAAP